MLFNLAGGGPDNRAAMVESSAVSAIVEALNSLGAGEGAPPELHSRLQANLIGALLNTALSPSAKKELIAKGALKPLLASLNSPDAVVQTMGTTALAYVNDKAERRSGSRSW